ncbi:MAG: S-layer homology domain-containing protein [Firmicutes bacterium]|nr:S-layer homology domain-containing protein [Bacillota bacterium]
MRSRLFRSSLCLILILALSLPALAAAEIKDVPPNHWAYSAVQKLLEKGYLSLYQDGTFRGDKAVDRYTFAVVVARLISEMAALGSGQPATDKVASEDLQLLRKLTTEFRDELVQLATTDESIQGDLEAAAKEQTVLREDLNKLLVQVYQLQQSTKALAEKDEKLSGELDAVRTQVEENGQAIAGLSQGLEKNRSELGSLRSDLEALQTKIDDEVLTRTSGTYVRQQSMEKELQKLSQEFESYRRSSEAELEDLKKENQWLFIGMIGSILLSFVLN